MQATNPIRLIIADTHPVYLQGLKSVFKKQSEIKVIAEATNDNQLIAMVEKHTPEVVITDILMPNLNGIQATKIIKANYHKVNVMILSSDNEPAIIRDLFQAGASGFLLKSDSNKEIISAVKAVNKGEYFFSKSISDDLINILDSFRKNQTKRIPELSKRELEITMLICSQLSNKEIANKLSLSERTVEDHRRHILIKTGSRNVVGIALYAIKNQIIKS